MSAARAGAQQQTSCTLLLSIDETDRQMDGRSPDSYVAPLVHSVHQLN